MEERLARSASSLTDSRKDSNDSPEGALDSIEVEVFHVQGKPRSRWRNLRGGRGL
ncbi:hypothetical protein NPIL_640081, partial [Nephila pilipes]